MSFDGDLYPTAGATSVMTTKGDMVDYDTVRQRLGIGSANQVLSVTAGLPAWKTLTLADSVLTTAGDVLYENNTPELARLPKGSDDDVLTLASGLPSWSAPAGGGAWTANGTASSASAVSELAVSISNTPDIVQLLFNVSDDQEPAGTNSSFSFTINDDTGGDYDQKIFGFYNSFDYDEFLSQSKALCDRVTNSASRAGCVWIFRGDSNLKGNTGIQWRCSMLTGSSATPPEYVALSAGGNNQITGDITSIEVMQSATDIIGKIQVNSMVYQ